MKIQLEIVRKRDAHAFEVLPRSWVVERTLCLDHRSPALRPRLRLPEGHEAMVLWAMVTLIAQHLATQRP